MSDRDLVLEIRDDVKRLAASLDRIDREGSLGTRAELSDHDARLNKLEGAGTFLRGAWTGVTSITALLAGSAGLAIGLAKIL